MPTLQIADGYKFDGYEVHIGLTEIADGHRLHLFFLEGAYADVLVPNK